MERLEQTHTPSFTTLQDEDGLWMIQDSQTGRVSRELFVSEKIAYMAAEDDFVTWEEAE